MEQKALARWLKIILIGVGICGLIIYFLLIPGYGAGIASRYPEFAYCYWPWLIFIWISGIPCFGVLVFGWRIAGNIGRDRSFCSENAAALKWVSWLAAGDAGYFFLGNVILLLLSMSHPGIALYSLFVVFAGVAVAVAAGVLSHLVQKAAELQEQSDLTI
ncbi:MAG: DUF2975 domain-containing protein [Lachnospiraceae bacterium]|nr:DUF2975 domain-containing protein [Lachnospiraceae bacterium]